jgi:hypothetical protein
MPNKYNVSVFTENNALSYYLLGAYMTDGNVVRNLQRCSLSSTDVSWLEDINKIISPNNLIKKYAKNCFTLIVHNKEICCWLNQAGCIPAKSLVLDAPNVPSEYFKDFMRGAMDGDGSISLYQRAYDNYKTLSCYLCGASPLFMEGISTRLNSLGLFHSFLATKPEDLQISIIDGRPCIPQHTQYRIKFSGYRAQTFLKWIYYTHDLLSLDRKRDVANTAFSYFEEKGKLIGKTSQYKGVSWHRTAKKWRATIVVANKQIHLGFFIDEQLAAEAYIKKQKELIDIDLYNGYQSLSLCS